MKTEFSADEILKMAEQLEKNGAAFYKFAAKEVSNEHIRKLLLDLANWEEGHQKTFARMRNTWEAKAEGKKTLATNDRNALYLQMLLDTHLFDFQTDHMELIKSKTTVDDVLQMAVKIEKDSVIFYLSLKNFFPDMDDRTIIDRIIEEEMDHITFLNREITTLFHQPL